LQSFGPIRYYVGMKKRILIPVIGAGGAAALAISLALALPASAALSNWSGSVASGSTINITDTTAGLTTTCTTGAIAGTTQAGNPPVLAMTSFTLGSSSKRCTAPLGGTATFALASGISVPVNYTSYSGGIVAFSMASMKVVLTETGPAGTCTAQIAGSAGVTYNATDDLLQFTPAGDSLKVTDTSGGCAGLVKTGDVLTINSGSGGFIASHSGTTGTKKPGLAS
jgi:hypothetical protein